MEQPIYVEGVFHQFRNVDYVDLTIRIPRASLQHNLADWHGKMIALGIQQVNNEVISEKQLPLNAT